ncbi:MAG: D-3-phosphoglycerate dehydrogenase [Sphingobacteriales bacterium]|jgi:D-3-phosphoglycerate dehydrogenase
MDNSTILIVDEVHEALHKKLKSHNYAIVELLNSTYTCIYDEIEKYHGLILRSCIKVDQKFIDKATKLKFIARAGAGMDNIDVDYAESKGIQCIHAAEGNANAVAEHTLGMLLSILNNFTKSYNEIVNGIWKREQNRGVELQLKTIGIIGYGNMGQAFAEKVAQLGARVIVYDKYKSNFSTHLIEEVSLEKLKLDSDILSIHLPLTNETKNLINSDFVNEFSKPIWLINTSRGEILNTNSIIKLIESEKIVGCALDVLEVEKADKLAKTEWFKPLTAFSNVLLTPHVAGWTFESYKKISHVLAAKILALKD